MISLQRYLSKGHRFFDLLEASAQEARQSVQALIKLLESPPKERTLDEFIQRRRDNKRINEELRTLLCTTFVTPLEREDIEALARALYRIPKTIEKFGERMLLSESSLRPGFFCQQAALLRESTDTVCQMVGQLRHRLHLEKVQEDNERLHHLEGEADKLILELLRDLYNGKHETLQVIILRDLFELLEKVIDRCRDAGNIVFQIVLKNS
jgi:uncharacterized protein